MVDFVPGHDIPDSLTLFMFDFLQCALDISEFFEKTSIGKRWMGQTRRIPPFPIRLWIMHDRIINKRARTNNVFEGWHNAFKSTFHVPIQVLPEFVKFASGAMDLRYELCKMARGIYSSPFKI